MRFGRLSDEAVEQITFLQRPVLYTDDIEPTELYAFNLRAELLLKWSRFPLRSEVENANQQRLERLADPTHIYVAEDRPGIDIRGNLVSQTTMRSLLDRLVVPREITLRVSIRFCRFGQFENNIFRSEHK
jgi:hypothetical protein